MAGIGFILRKLAERNDFIGIIKAYFHSAIVAVGPWLLIITTFGTIHLLTLQTLGPQNLDEFLSIILWNFLFSFILSSGLYMICARYVSDCLYQRSLSFIPGVFITGLLLLLIPAIALGTGFYALYATMPPLLTILSITNFVLLSQIWLVMLYLSLLRNFRAITLSWIFGTLLSLILSIPLGKSFGQEGLLIGINVGFILLMSFLQAQIFVEYPFPFQIPPKFFSYFKKYRGLFWSGIFLFAGMWVDKLIMWWAPEAILHANSLRTNPLYDGGMFFSSLSMIPILALFIFSLETNFYVSYIKYIKHIEHNAPLSLIEAERKNIIRRLTENGRSFLILQGSITLLIIVLASQIFQWVGINFLLINIFRFGALGTFFGALNLCIIIYFSYFDSQNNMLIITATMLISNTIFTLYSLFLGFPYYGCGYCLSMILTFCVACVLFFRFLHRLTYHIFITNTVKRISYNP